MKTTVLMALSIFLSALATGASEVSNPNFPHTHDRNCACSEAAPVPPRRSFGAGASSIFVAVSALALAKRSFKSS
jgi:hypothetical protein